MAVAKPAPPAPAHKPAPPVNHMQKLIALKGKTQPTWQSVLETIEVAIAAFEQVWGTMHSPSAPPAVGASKVVLKG